jgi:prepilin-type processing-associated H-X9-DG protein
MDMLGKTLATIGAAWLCLLAVVVVFDYVQNAINGQANMLFAGWSVVDFALLSVPGIIAVLVGTKIARLF